jgi:hypothetical protein
MTDPKPKRGWLYLTASLFGAAVVASAAARGYYLLGTDAAVLFGLISAVVLFVVWRIFLTAHRFRRFQEAVALVFAVSIFSVLAFPACFSHDLHYFIENHRIEQLTQSQLESVFASSPKFAELGFSCRFTKCIVVEVNGRINSQSDLRDLRRMIFDTCPHVCSRWLFWDLSVQDADIIYHHKCDLDFVPTWGGIGIDGKVINCSGQM